MDPISKALFSLIFFYLTLEVISSFYNPSGAGCVQCPANHCCQINIFHKMRFPSQCVPNSWRRCGQLCVCQSNTICINGRCQYKYSTTTTTTAKLRRSHTHRHRYALRHSNKTKQFQTPKPRTGTRKSLININTTTTTTTTTTIATTSEEPIETTLIETPTTEETTTKPPTRKTKRAKGRKTSTRRPFLETSTYRSTMEKDL